MGDHHREISISEFFEKNRHLLGYDNKTKALLTIVKEGVDNSLDACEEAGILPEIYVNLREVCPERFEIILKDNGPGVEKKQIPNIFGKLLYGSKFHRLRQSRGQQGIGISGAVLYSQLTTGSHTEIKSSRGDRNTHTYMIKIDVKRNKPISIEEHVDRTENWRGTWIRMLAEGVYKEHKQSVFEYLKRTAIANPHAHMIFNSPNGRIEFRRAVDYLPKQSKEIMPHLNGIEIGLFQRMIYETKTKNITGFLMSEFSKIGRKTALEICKKAGIDPKTKTKNITDEESKKIIHAVKNIKLMRPPTDCLSALGEELIKKGLKKELNPEFVVAVSRPPEVYRGRPFQVEVGIGYGGSIQNPVLMRFANRVPLLYQQGECAITKSAKSVDWKRYSIEANELPKDPIVIFVHLVSVWVPFTSESKEAIASYPIIMKEIKLSLQEAARKLSIYLSGKRKAHHLEKKKKVFEKYSEEVANALNSLTFEPKERIMSMILKIINSKINVLEEGENHDRK